MDQNGKSFFGLCLDGLLLLHKIDKSFFINGNTEQTLQIYSDLSCKKLDQKLLKFKWKSLSTYKMAIKVKIIITFRYKTAFFRNENSELQFVTR